MYLFIESIKWYDQIIQLTILYGYFFGKNIIITLIWIIVYSCVLSFIWYFVHSYQFEWPCPLIWGKQSLRLKEMLWFFFFLFIGSYIMVNFNSKVNNHTET